MGEMSLIDAVKTGDYAMVEALIKGGTDVNQQDEQGWTPLNFAAGKGSLSLVKLLVEHGADIFKVGRDRRTPYDIALAASRVSVAKYLREAEDRYPGEKAARPETEYCKAYHLRDLRNYHRWSDNRIDLKKKEDGSADNEILTDEKIVFIHQDFTVTKSMYHNENVIFDNVDSDWREFCANTLGFKVPDDLDVSVLDEVSS
jgi:hypothetical protein